MLAAYLFLTPYMPSSVQWMLDYMGVKEMLGMLAGVGDMKLVMAIWRGEWGIRERVDVAMKAVGL